MQPKIRLFKALSEIIIWGRRQSYAREDFSAAQALDTAWNTARAKFSHLFSKNCGKFSDLQQFKGEYSDISSLTNFIIGRRQNKKNKEVSL